MVTNNLTGLSTDTKPYAEKESLFLELDTGNWYYCTGGNAWTKVDGLSGVKVDNALIGNSTDGKPNASENTLFIEVDTGKTYYCDGSSWAEIPSGGGGGGGSSFIVNFDLSGGTPEADKTFEEIRTAYLSGQSIIGKLDYDILPLTTCSEYYICFLRMQPIGDPINSISITQFIIEDTGTVSVMNGTIS